jgi:hypothetical protein
VKHPIAKLFGLFLLELTCLCGFGATVLEPVTTGDWSAPVKGLRGRLLFAEDPPYNGTRVAVVYLELQNVSSNGAPMEIYYDGDHSLAGALLDGVGLPVRQARMPADIMSPFPYWIMLPVDSSLRFRVSVYGYSTPPNAGMSIGLMSGDWIIPPRSHATYYLTGTFKVTPPKSDDPFRSPLAVWKGVLKLPKVKIPVNGP